MSKRTPEEIIHSVKRYQQGETSQGAEAKRLGVSKQAFQDWVRIYETYGESGFLRTENRRYSKELKLSAVQAYLNGEGSHAAICKKYGISSRTQLQNWIKMYNGHKELKASRTGGCSLMTKGRKTTFEERVEIASYCISHGHNYAETSETLRCPISRHEITLSNTKQAEFLHYRITAAKENRKILLQRWKSFKRS